MGAIAHIDQTRIQSLSEHSVNVAEMTAKFCDTYHFDGCDVKPYAYMVGLAHDIGKYSARFQTKITEQPELSVDHSSAGARVLARHKMLAGAFAVAGHHGGIPNGWDLTKGNLLERVNKKQLEPFDSYQEDFQIEERLEPALLPYDESFFTRMLFSALVDADFLDTERFMDARRAEARGKFDTLDILYHKMMTYIRPWRIKDVTKSDINRMRTDILEKCLEQGQRERGLYSLTVPTGGGKTISSLAFGLQHAVTNHMERLIYVIPYTSIIEQTVEIFCDILGENNVLACYSGSLLCSDDEGSAFYESYKLSIENWDAPVIVTTNEQFFESLYSNRVSKCRKLHNISNSVVVFDEVQTIPLHCLLPCVKAIQKLVENYMATAVLCTATQPPLERWMEPLRVREIYPDYETAYERLKRTQISNIGDISEEELVAGILSYRQCLVIVNRRKDAQDLYQRMGEEGTFHLSTYMTPMDRKQTLYVIKERLQHQQICRVVSTSLVEAGVDIDFPVVYRELTGLDSIIQAAGRCNREAKRSWEDSTVFVFRLHEPPKTIQKNVAITEETFLKFQKLDGLDTMQYYFTTIQNLDPEGLDQYGILDAFAKGLDGVKLPFKRVSDDFRLIHSGTKMVIIPVDEEAKDLLRILEAKIANKDRFGSVLRKVSVYAINLYDYEYRKLLDAGNIYELLDGVGVLQILSLYTRERGLQYVEEEGMNVLLL